MPYWRLHYDLVWATNGREPLIGPAEERAIRRSFDSTIVNMGLIPHAIGFMPDHVHVVVSIPPKIAVTDVVKRLKGASTREVSKSVGNNASIGFSWQADYGALSFGDNAMQQVVEYVERQAAHHAEGRLWPKLEQADDGFRKDDPECDE